MGTLEIILVVVVLFLFGGLGGGGYYLSRRRGQGFSVLSQLFMRQDSVGGSWASGQAQTATASLFPSPAPLSLSVSPLASGDCHVQMTLITSFAERDRRLRESD